MANQNIRIGTSGYSYKDWLGNFYPQFCPSQDFLRFYSSRFTTVEIDMTFYRVPTETMVRRWHKSTPGGFTFAAKFPRTVTHEGTRADRCDTAGHFVGIMQGLEEKLGPLLLQFPYSFKPDQFKLLEAIVDSLPEGPSYSVEVRNRKWLDGELFDFLRERKIALCLVDHPWMPRCAEQTASFAYVRFLGDQRKIDSDFSYVRDGREEALQWWADSIGNFASDGREVYVFFNNHFSGHAPTSAYRAMELLGIRA